MSELSGMYTVAILVRCDSCGHGWEHRHETMLRSADGRLELADLPELLRCPICSDVAGEPVERTEEAIG